MNASAMASVGILLQSKSERFPNGLGNDSDALGRGIMDHHYKLGATAKVEGHLDKYYKGRRANGFYIRLARYGSQFNLPIPSEIKKLQSYLKAYESLSSEKLSHEIQILEQRASNQLLAKVTIYVLYKKLLRVFLTLILDIFLQQIQLQGTLFVIIHHNIFLQFLLLILVCS